MTDNVSDMLIRLKNAYMAKHDVVEMPATKLRENIANLLVERGFVTSVERIENKPQDILRVQLRYIRGKAAMVDIKRVSKPGRRLYATAEKLPKVLGGYGMSVISTSQGVLSDAQAREKSIGGEILFKIW